MSKPKAKHRLHASKVDRIAIVDRPCVPDAQMVIFKRRNDEVIDKLLPEHIEKYQVVEQYYEKELVTFSFKEAFLYKATQAAVEVLEEKVWDALYETISIKDLKSSFGEFESILIDVLSKMSIEKQEDAEEQKLTKEEIMKPFARGLSVAAIYESFSYMKAAMAYVMTSYNRLKEPDKVISGISNKFQEFIVDNVDEVIANKREFQVEKAGRIISRSRLQKLKEAITLLSEMTEEAEARYSKSKQEASTMELEKILEQLQTISASVEVITQKQNLIETTLKEHKLLLTEEEKAQIEAEKIESEKKAKEEQEAQEAELAEKKKAEEAEAAELAEKQKKEAEEIEAQKKEKEEALEKRFANLETITGHFKKIIDALGKKYGVRTSIEGEEESTDKVKKDPFGKAVRG